MNKVCIICTSTFEASSNRSQYCSKECKKHFYFLKHQERLRQGTKDVDYVVDMWNGFVTPRIYGKWIKSMHPGKSTKDYLAEFPGAPLCCEKDKESTTKNSGLHMKDPKYRKMASDAIKGSKNPNHRLAVDDITRKKRSPFSKKFVKYKSDEDRKEFLEAIDWSARITSTQLEWWLNKGYTEEDAQKLLKERQTTFSLEKCIQKWGEEKGTKIFNERQTKWLKSFIKLNYSKVSQELFKKIYDKVKNKFNDIYFATLSDGNILEFNNGKNYEYTLKLSDRIINPDFFVKDCKKIIEFDGVYWHRNNPENKKRESVRDTSIINSGYQVLHISEREWYESPEEVLKKCIDFLYD
jgi:hypothetical protein